MGGMMMSLTSELTTFPSAPPMTTPIASASAFDFVRNALNPPADGRRDAVISVLDDLRQILALVDPVLDLRLGRDPADDAGPRRDDFLDGRRQVAGVPMRELGGGVHPAASRRSEYSEPTPLIRIRSTWFT